MLKKTDEHIGANIIDIAYNFRQECTRNGTKYKKEEFLLGVIIGMKVFIVLEYKEGQELKTITS